MVRASAVDVVLNMERLPLLPGALEVVLQGIFSSLQPQNVRLRRAIREVEAAQHPYYALLFDPQTASGLLASIPADQAQAYVPGASGSRLSGRSPYRHSTSAERCT